MKTTAEEKLLRQMERIVEDSAKKFPPSEFRKAMASTSRIASGAIAKHERMIKLWRAMNSRMQKRAKLVEKERTLNRR